MKFSKNVNNRKAAPKLILFNEKKIIKDSDNFWCRKLTLKVRILQFSTTFMQVYVRPKKLSFGSSSAFDLKEGPVDVRKCASKVGAY